MTSRTMQSRSRTALAPPPPPPPTKNGQEKTSETFTVSLSETTLECPTCLDICIPPIYVCLSGHHICGSCKNKSSTCGTCKSEFPGTRNFFMEHCVENSSLSCCYSTSGCTKKIMGKYLASHQKNCIYKNKPPKKVIPPKTSVKNLPKKTTTPTSTTASAVRSRATKAAKMKATVSSGASVSARGRIIYPRR